MYAFMIFKYRLRIYGIPKLIDFYETLVLNVHSTRRVQRADLLDPRACGCICA
jgi:hypothetical protein